MQVLPTCTVAFNPFSMTEFLSPRANEIDNLQKSALPEIGAYSLSKFLL